MKTTVGIVNWNSGHFLEECVDSVLRVPGVKVFVLDNHSTDGSTDFLASPYERVTYTASSDNKGFAGGVNRIIRGADTSYVLILNPDVCVTAAAIQLMEDFMESCPRAAAVGGYVGDKYLPRRLPTPWSLAMENLGSPSRPMVVGDDVVRVEQVAAAATMIRRQAIRNELMFDEEFYPAWYEDVDFCRRLKRDDWEVYFALNAKFPHSGGYSAKTMGSERFLYAYYRNQVRYARKWFRWHEVVLVKASVVLGMSARMIARPWNIPGYVKVVFGALFAW